MSVQRYDVDYNMVDPAEEMPVMKESDLGDYVPYSDYQSLAAENEGLRRALEEIHLLADQGSLEKDTMRTRIRTRARQSLSRKAAP